MKQIVVSDIPRTFTALAEWSACMVYLSQCPRRLKGKKFAVIAMTALVIQSLWLELTGGLDVVLWIPCMAAAIALMFGFICLCGNIPVAGIGYITARAFLLAEFTAAVEWQLYYYTAYTLGYRSNITALLFLVLVYSAIFLLAWRGERYWQGSQSISAFINKELWPPILISLTSFVMSNLSFIYSNTPFSSTGVMEILIFVPWWHCPVWSPYMRTMLSGENCLPEKR